MFRCTALEASTCPRGDCKAICQPCLCSTGASKRKTPKYYRWGIPLYRPRHEEKRLQLCNRPRNLFSIFRPRWPLGRRSRLQQQRPTSYLYSTSILHSNTTFRRVQVRVAPWAKGKEGGAGLPAYTSKFDRAQRRQGQGRRCPLHSEDARPARSGIQ